MISQLGRGKEGHASDSVYKDVHDMQVLNLSQVPDNQRTQNTKPLCPQAVRLF
jgi:hypothetical protein